MMVFEFLELINTITVMFGPFQNIIKKALGKFSGVKCFCYKTYSIRYSYTNTFI